MDIKLPPASPWLRLDALLLAVLVAARLRIDTLAEQVAVPLHQADVARHPMLGSLLPRQAADMLAQQGLVDPIGLLLIVAILGCLLLYFLAAELPRPEPATYRLRLVLIWAIVLLGVVAPSVKMMLLRQGSGPASYSHDGGVIQTEAAIDFALGGRNPYVEDYTKTPMAEWGLGEFRTALYHYPYLPWTYLFSAPFKLLSDRALGWYDQRMVYLLLFLAMLALLPGLASARQSRLLLVMSVGLNPIMGSDLIYGQNDSFVLAWIVLGLWLLVRQRRLAAAVALGLACASKPTAWFLVPFYGVLLAGQAGQLPGASRGTRLARWGRAVGQAGWPVLAAAGLIIGPYLAWSAPALWDDVWGWSSGTSATAYQIWGWGASNLVLAFGWVQSRFAYWPFAVVELLLGVPVLAWLLWRQARENSLPGALWRYGVFLFLFFYVSRFFNENYLGFIVALLALGVLADRSPVYRATPDPSPAADLPPGSGSWPRARPELRPGP